MEPPPLGRSRRSYVDLPSNTGIIGPLLTTRDLGKFVQGRLPPGSLPSLLHESTHHWCFQSAVGTAMAILYLRAMAAVAEHEDGGQPSGRRLPPAVDDLTRYEYAARVLEPLFEGLALFAEFDLAPDSGQVWPLQLTWTTLLYGGPVRDSPDLEAWMTRGRELIDDMRRQKQLIRRKVDMLLGPLRPSSNPYLAGYLTVKWLWHGVARQRPHDLADRSAFFVFLRHFVFCDPGLVWLLLEADIKEMHERFAVRVLTRLQHLRTALADLAIMESSELLPLLDAYEWSPDNPPPPRMVGIDPDEALAGQGAMHAAIELVERRANGDGVAREVWATVVEMLNGRDALILDRCAVMVEVRHDGVVRVDYDPSAGLFFSAGQCSDRRLWGKSGTGTAIMLLSRAGGPPYFAICFRGEVIMEIPREADDDCEGLLPLRSLARGAERTAGLLSAWNRYVEQWTRAAAPGRESGSSRVAGLTPGLGGLVDDLYGRLSLPPWLPEVRRAEALRRLGTHGIASMFPGRRIRLLPVVAGWSLGGARTEHLEALAASAGGSETLGEIIEAVNATSRECWDADLVVVEDGEIRGVTV